MYHGEKSKKRDWYLIQRRGGSNVWKLSKSDIFLIGKDSCDVNIKSLDKCHALLCFDPSSENFTVRDLNSTNGTYLNDKRIEPDFPKNLQENDILYFGLQDDNLYEVQLGGIDGGEVRSRGSVPESSVDYHQHHQQNRNQNRSTSIESSGGGSDFLYSSPEKNNHQFMQGPSSSSISRISSPGSSLAAFDSGRSTGSTSTPSSPAKEMSPTIPTASNNSSVNSASPTLLRRLQQYQQPISNIPQPSEQYHHYHNQNDNNTNTYSSLPPYQHQRTQSRQSQTQDQIRKLPTSSYRASSLEPADICIENEVFQSQHLHQQPQSLNLPSSSRSKEADTNKEHLLRRSGSFSGRDSVRSTKTPLYGTPVWWPDESGSEDENCTFSKRNYLISNYDASKHSKKDFNLERDGSSSINTMNTNKRGELENKTGNSLISKNISSQPSSFNSVKSDSDSISMSKKLPPMAFTIDFGAETESPSNNTGKKSLDISVPLSKFAPRHRRQLSLTKVEDIREAQAQAKEKGVEEQEKCKVNDVNNRKVIKLDESLCKKSNLRKSTCSSGLEASTAGSFKTTFSSPTSSLNSGGSNNGAKKTNNNNTTSTNSSFGALTKSNSNSNIIMSNKNLNKNEQLSSNNNNVKTTRTTTNREKSFTKISTSNSSKPKENASIEKKEGSNKKSSTCKKDHDNNDDNTSETGTYTIEKESSDVEKAREEIDVVFGTEKKKEKKTTSTTAKATAQVTPPASKEINRGSPGWLREWAECASENLSKNNASSTEPQFYLQETENLVSQIQERVNSNSAKIVGKSKIGHSFDSEEELNFDESSSPWRRGDKDKAGRKLLRNSPLPRDVMSDSGYIGYISDSSNEGGGHNYRPFGPGARLANKPYNIRSMTGGAAAGYDSDNRNRAINMSARIVSNSRTTTTPSTSTNISNRPLTVSTPNTSNSPFGRNDGGRFSLRVSKSKSAPRPTILQMNSSSVHHQQNLQNNNTSSSYSRQSGDLSLSKMRQQLTQSTKIVGNNTNNNKKPPVGSGGRSNSTLTAKEVELANWKRRKSYDPMRAAAESKKKNASNRLIQLNDSTDLENSCVVEEENSSLDWTSPNNNVGCGLSEDEDLAIIVDELEEVKSPSLCGSCNRSSPQHQYEYSSLYSSQTPNYHRQKSKFEALDNLVIATIHSLSNKVRNSSRRLLENLKNQHRGDESSDLLEEMVSQLKELENSSPSPTKTQQNLSASLKNLKKIEQVILVLDKVLCEDQDQNHETTETTV